MNDFVHLAHGHSGGRDLVEIAVRVAEALCGPIGMRSPDDVARELRIRCTDPVCVAAQSG